MTIETGLYIQITVHTHGRVYVPYTIYSSEERPESKEDYSLVQYELRFNPRFSDLESLHRLFVDLT